MTTCSFLQRQHFLKELVSQTLGGDHGGGSPDEVDSALLAVDVEALQVLRGAAKSGFHQPKQPAALPVPVMAQVPVSACRLNIKTLACRVLAASWVSC